MSYTKLEHLDKILFSAKILKQALFEVWMHPQIEVEISGIVDKSTKHFLYPFYGSNDILIEDTIAMKTELRDWFLSQNDHRVQDRFGNYLIDQLQDLLGPVYGEVVFFAEDYIQTVENSQKSKYISDAAFYDNYVFCQRNTPTIIWWISIMRDSIKIFTPEKYSEHRKMLEELVPYYDDFGNEVFTPPSREPQGPEEFIKRSKKKNPQLTTKQQMILLDTLGFRTAPILSNLSTEQKGTVLANLLNRSEQEVRGMLTYWDGKAPKTDYDCSNPDDQDKVIDFLLNQNVKV